MKISLINIAIAFSILLNSCTSHGPVGSISGKIDGASGKTIYLESFINNRSVFTDSTVAGADGSFALVPSRPLEMNFYRLVLDNKNFVTLITDSTESPVVKADLGKFEESLRVDGSANSESLRDLEMTFMPFDKKDKELREKFMKASITPEEKSMLNEEMVANRKERTEIVKKWLETHSSTPAALWAVQHLDPRTDMAMFTKVFAELKGTFGHTVIYKGMKQQVDLFMSKEKGANAEPSSPSAISAGNPAPEIALSDPKGNVRKLSDLKGKTVLIDFWASWCGPCRRENPNVVAAYDKYNGDGFEVFSVSLDKAKDPWLQAIEADKLKWPNHVSDLKWWDSEAAKTYGVRSIPFTVLVDKDGKIIGQNIRGPVLEEKLKAIYGH